MRTPRPASRTHHPGRRTVRGHHGAALHGPSAPGDLRTTPSSCGEEGAEVLEQAVDWANENHGDDFFFKVGAFSKDGEGA
ncbi:hypothetical protein HBB16_02035 [Pseudonocardia sp. MCCB 268]|nr:hypothetical protein [Pseudonocardia cytotoxica]